MGFYVITYTHEHGNKRRVARTVYEGKKEVNKALKSYKKTGAFKNPRIKKIL